MVLTFSLPNATSFKNPSAIISTIPISRSTGRKSGPSALSSRISAARCSPISITSPNNALMTAWSFRFRPGRDKRFDDRIRFLPQRPQRLVDSHLAPIQVSLCSDPHPRDVHKYRVRQMVEDVPLEVNAGGHLSEFQASCGQAKDASLR